MLQSSAHLNNKRRVWRVLTNERRELRVLANEYLVVKDAEPKPRLPLDQLDLLHLPGPGGGVREDLQRPRPGHHALPDNHNVGDKIWNKRMVGCTSTSYIELEDTSLRSCTGERIRENSLLACDNIRVGIILSSYLYLPTFTSGVSKTGSEMSSSDWRLPHSIFWKLSTLK